MVQIGNIHIGKAQTASPPHIDIKEASILWDLLVARYKCIEETQIYHNFAHDPEFKEIIEKIGIDMLERQVNELEKEMNIYGLPMPKRPPKSVNRESSSEMFSDEYMFAQIFEGCQAFIDYLAESIRSITTNDALRTVLTDFFNEEVAIFDKLCRYGKLKGWIAVRPVYKAD